MKSKLFLIHFFSSLLLIGCTSNSKLAENRGFLKEYAYCRCFQYASNDSAFLKNDISLSVYRDIANYNFIAYNKIDSLSRIVASEIKPSQIADYQNKKAISFDCFLFYKSKRLNSLIKSLDKEADRHW